MLKHFVPFILLSISSNIVFADIMGCGTLIKSDPVNQKPEYASNALVNPRGTASKVANTVGDPSILSAAAQGGFIGLAAAAVIAAGSGIVDAVSQKTNTELNKEQIEKEQEAEKEQKWEYTYRLTIQPDFGDVFTINYQFVTAGYKPGFQAGESLAENGSRVYFIYAPATNSYKFLSKPGIFSSAPPNKFEDIQSISADYISDCYTNYGKREKRQLVYVKGQGLTQVDLPAPISAALNEKTE